MPIRFHCENCRARIRVPDGSEGRRVKCPRCGCLQRVGSSSLARSPEPVIVAADLPSRGRRKAHGAADGTAVLTTTTVLAEPPNTLADSAVDMTDSDERFYHDESDDSAELGATTTTAAEAAEHAAPADDLPEAELLGPSDGRTLTDDEPADETVQGSDPAVAAEPTDELSDDEPDSESLQALDLADDEIRPSLLELPPLPDLPAPRPASTQTDPQQMIADEPDPTPDADEPEMIFDDPQDESDSQAAPKTDADELTADEATESTAPHEVLASEPTAPSQTVQPVAAAAPVLRAIPLSRPAPRPAVTGTTDAPKSAPVRSGYAGATAPDAPSHAALLVVAWTLRAMAALSAGGVLRSIVVQISHDTPLRTVITNALPVCVTVTLIWAAAEVVAALRVIARNSHRR